MTWRLTFGGSFGYCNLTPPMLQGREGPQGLGEHTTKQYVDDVHAARLSGKITTIDRFPRHFQPHRSSVVRPPKPKLQPIFDYPDYLESYTFLNISKYSFL